MLLGDALDAGTTVQDQADLAQGVAEVENQPRSKRIKVMDASNSRVAFDVEVPLDTAETLTKDPELLRMKIIDPNPPVPDESIDPDFFERVVGAPESSARVSPKTSPNDFFLEPAAKAYFDDYGGAPHHERLQMLYQALEPYYPASKASQLISRYIVASESAPPGELQQGSLLERVERAEGALGGLIAVLRDSGIDSLSGLGGGPDSQLSGIFSNEGVKGERFKFGSHTIELKIGGLNPASLDKTPLGNGSLFLAAQAFAVKRFGGDRIATVEELDNTGSGSLVGLNYTASFNRMSHTGSVDADSLCRSYFAALAYRHVGVPGNVYSTATIPSGLPIPSFRIDGYKEVEGADPALSQFVTSMAGSASGGKEAITAMCGFEGFALSKADRDLLTGCLSRSRTLGPPCSGGLLDVLTHLLARLTAIQTLVGPDVFVKTSFLDSRGQRRAVGNNDHARSVGMVFSGRAVYECVARGASGLTIFAETNQEAYTARLLGEIAMGGSIAFCYDSTGTMPFAAVDTSDICSPSEYPQVADYVDIMVMSGVLAETLGEAASYTNVVPPAAPPPAGAAPAVVYGAPILDHTRFWDVLSNDQNNEDPVEPGTHHRPAPQAAGVPAANRAAPAGLLRGVLLGSGDMEAPVSTLIEQIKLCISTLTSSTFVRPSRLALSLDRGFTSVTGGVRALSAQGTGLAAPIGQARVYDEIFFRRYPIGGVMSDTMKLGRLLRKKSRAEEQASVALLGQVSGNHTVNGNTLFALSASMSLVFHEWIAYHDLDWCCAEYISCGDHRMPHGAGGVATLSRYACSYLDPMREDVANGVRRLSVIFCNGMMKLFGVAKGPIHGQGVFGGSVAARSRVTVHNAATAAAPARLTWERMDHRDGRNMHLLAFHNDSLGMAQIFSYRPLSSFIAQDGDSLGLQDWSELRNDSVMRIGYVKLLNVPELREAVALNAARFFVPNRKFQLYNRVLASYLDPANCLGGPIRLETLGISFEQVANLEFGSSEGYEMAARPFPISALVQRPNSSAAMQSATYHTGLCAHVGTIDWSRDSLRLAVFNAARMLQPIAANRDLNNQARNALNHRANNIGLLTVMRAAKHNRPAYTFSPGMLFNGTASRPVDPSILSASLIWG